MTKTAVISYIPALHRGYTKFFRENPGALYVLGQNLLTYEPRLDRDVRAMPAAEIVRAIESLNIMESVSVLTKPVLKESLKIYKRIVMPDEDINRRFAARYLKGRQIMFRPAFLRWDRQISTTEHEVPADRVISSHALNRKFMRLASAEAAKSPDWWRQVGALAVKNGKPLLWAHNTPMPTADYTLNIFGDPRSNFDAGESIELSKVIHGEAGLIATAARKGISLKGTELYLTVFPCPVCARLVATSGIKRVYYAQGYSLLDAEDILKAADIEIVLVK